MRVLFLSQIVPYPPHGGVLQRGYHLLRELGRHARVHLLAFLHPDELRTEAAVQESRMALEKFCERVEYFRLWPKTSVAHHMAAVGLGVMSTQPFSVIAHRSAAYRRRVLEVASRGGVDLIHVDTLALAPFVDFSHPLPAVLTHHNIESQLMERRAKAERNWLAGRILSREAAKLSAYEQRVARRFDVNILVSRNDEAILTSRVSGVRTALVPNGVDVDYFTPHPESAAEALVYTGGLNMFANRDAVMFFLREIWPKITAQRPNAQFYAIGQEPPKEIVEFSAKDPRVVVTGYVDDIRPYVRKAAVYVVPLRVGGGTRLKVLDAMAMGKAMVSTSVGCEGIEVRAGEHLTIADSPQKFAEETVALLTDPARRERLGRAARSLVEARYSWRTVGDQLMSAYDHAIAHAGHRR